MDKKNTNIYLFFLGLFFALNSLLFVAREVEQIDFLSLASLKIIYFLYFILALVFALFLYLNKQGLDLNLFKKILLTLLPTVLIWVYGFSESKHFSYFFKLLADFYFIGICFYFLFIIKKYQKISDFLGEFKLSKKIKLFEFFNFKKNIVFGLVFLVFILNLSFGLFHLTKYAAVDEALWTEGRITKFWSNIQDREWSKTNVSDKPGITVAILSGAGLNWVDPKDNKYEHYDFVEKKNFAFRFPILLFCSLAIFVFFSTIKRLFGEKISLVSVILIGLSPLLLGISTIINPDSLLWIFTTLSILFYFLYMKDSQNKDLYLAGVFLGFSLLTKYVANILFVFFLALIFLNLIFNKENSLSIKEYFKKYLLDYIILIFFSLLTFFIFLPATWVEPMILFESTILSQAFEKFISLFSIILLFILFDTVILKNRILSSVLNYISKFSTWIFKFIISTFFLIIIFVLANVYLKMKWFDMESILASPKTSFAFSNILELFLTNFYSLLFGITPIVLFGITYFLLKSLKLKKIENNFYCIFYLLIFIILYYLGSSLNNVSATVRYQIILYPLASIISAFGLVEFFKDLKILKKYKKTLLALLILISASGLYLISPFYFSYANFLLPKNYVLNLKDMGDGSYEAAQYLNSLPDAKNLKVWTDKRGVCQFFVGKFCKSGLSFDKKSYTFDYFVVSAGRQNRTTKMTLSKVGGGNDTITRLDKLYLEEETAFRLNIGNRENNYIKIISKDKVEQNY
jgi:4-amino-4-deoxy-L-arabinose transferase-like glycosyltransferase